MTEYKRDTAFEYNERLATITGEIVAFLRELVVKHEVSHRELMQSAMWLGKLPPKETAGMILLYLEATVMQREDAGRPGSLQAVEGPYRRDDHAVLTPPYKMPQRPDEPGEPFFFKIKIEDLDGKPLSGVKLDCWHSANDGSYSGFTGDAPVENLRGIMESDENGEIVFGTIRPVPYLAVQEGQIYGFLNTIGSHAWRPAHFHFKLNKDGYDELITQVYFKGDKVIDELGDPCDGVRESQVIEVGEGSDPEIASTYGLKAPYQTGEYTFVLRPSS